MSKFHYVYRITCLNYDSAEKYYYGSRSSKAEPKFDDYWSSSKYVKIAIDKYGIHYFKKKIIKTFSSREEANKYEILLHHKFRVDEHKLFFNKSRASNFGIRATGLFSKGKTYEELYGEEKSKELKKIRSETFKKINKHGEKNPMYGKNHSEEMKKKLSTDRQGEKHPGFNSFWVTNGIHNLKLQKNSEIPEGFTIGRVPHPNILKSYLKSIETKKIKKQKLINEYLLKPKLCIFCKKKLFNLRTK